MEKTNEVLAKESERKSREVVEKEGCASDTVETNEASQDIHSQCSHRNGKEVNMKSKSRNKIPCNASQKTA